MDHNNFASPASGGHDSQYTDGTASPLLNETRISLTQLAHREDRNPSTTHRWAKRGVRGVVLETILVGGNRYTSVEAFERFVARTSDVQMAPTSSPSQTQLAAIARAEARLKEEGL